MITTDVTLTGTPQAITVPDTGARLQSVGGLNFNWRASTTTPTDLSNHVKIMMFGLIKQPLSTFGVRLKAKLSR